MSKTKKYILLILIAGLSLSVFPQERYTGQKIEDIFKLSEEEIDLGISCLIIAKIVNPDLNVPKYDLLLFRMANRIQSFAKYSSEPLVRIGAMNTYLYQKGRWNNNTIFTYDIDDLELKRKENHFINYYLDTRKGSCVTMPMLCVILADKLDWPIKAVLAPKHIFCRYDDRVFEQGNIDATVEGGYISDEQYIQDAVIPEIALKNKVYLHSMPKKQFLSVLLLNLGVYLNEIEGNIQKAIYFTSLALKNDSTLSDGHWNMHKYYIQGADSLSSILNSEIKEIKTRHDVELANEKLSSKNRNNMPINPEYKQYMKSNPYLKNSDQISFNKNLQLELEIQKVKQKYIPVINECHQRAIWHKEKSEKLGIVLELPDEFYIKQKQNVEKFRKTGKF